MKIETVIMNSNNHIPHFTRGEHGQSLDENKNNNKTDLLVYSLLALGVITAGIFIGRNSNKTPSQVQTVESYVTKLAKGLGELTGEKINPESLSCIMSKEDFLNAISGLKRENYIASAENIKNGIFRADLHSHSLYSDGKGSVENILTQVCNYADMLHSKTGEKFLFALTDHDSIEGVKEALKIISKNPEKFKNVKFVIGSEVSFLIKSTKTSNPCETSELLVYGINPFSKEVNSFFSGLNSRRLEMRKNYIKDLQQRFSEVKFSEEEFLNIFLSGRITHIPMMNSYWQLYHYGQIKTVLSDTAKAKGLEPEQYFKEIMEKAPSKLNLHEFKKAGLIEEWINENPAIAEINNKYRPNIDKDGNIIKNWENLIDDIAVALKNEEECSIGFAHPYYISERSDNLAGIINEVKLKAGDLFKVTESYHQAYSQGLVQNHSADIEKINKMCEDANLLPVGGRDNHKADWLKM